MQCLTKKQLGLVTTLGAIKW